MRNNLKFFDETFFQKSFSGVWGRSPHNNPEFFQRVRGRQVRLWRPVQVRSLRSVRITAILLCKSRANLLQSCSLAGGCRSRNPPANGRRPRRVKPESVFIFFEYKKSPTTFSVVGDFFAFGIEAKGFRFDRLVACGKAAGGFQSLLPPAGLHWRPA